MALRDDDALRNHRDTQELLSFRVHVYWRPCVLLQLLTSFLTASFYVETK